MSDAVLAGRTQCAFTIMFHYLFPILTMGLGTLIAVLKTAQMVKKDERYGVAARFWAKIFAVNFALGHAANFLSMLAGEEPGAERVRALETYMVTVCDHGVSASTFAARVIVSTGSDLISAVVGAVGALKGPLHGGAPGPVLAMLLEIGEADQVAGYLRAKLQGGERLKGFGHRDYRVRDPRAVVLEAAAKRLSAHQGDGRQGDEGLYALAKHVEGEALSLLAEHKPGRRLQHEPEVVGGGAAARGGPAADLVHADVRRRTDCGLGGALLRAAGRGAHDPAEDGLCWRSR